MTYTVALPAFHGPLDLLLHLVKRHEVDVLDIPVARLADQFLEHLAAVEALDVELAGDFVVMAATLMEIKSRSLLPAPPEAEGDDEPADDPRRELVRQLLEYRRFKDAASALEECAARQAERSPRRPTPAEPGAAAPPPVRAVEVWDLVSAFARLMRETQALKPAAVVHDETPQHVHEAAIRERVRAGGGVAFRELFAPPFHRARLVGLFLALLELVKQRAVALEQAEPFGDIWVRPAEAEVAAAA